MTELRIDSAAYQLSAEYIAFVILLMLSAHSVSRGKAKLRQQHIFLICVSINFLSIVIDFASVYALANAQTLPVGLVYAINTLYFFQLLCGEFRIFQLFAGTFDVTYP